MTKEITRQAKVYDCFTFFNELDLLEMRLRILNDVVDKFVIVEATKTFSGKDKELFFKKNKSRFAEFSDKIIHVVIDDYPEWKSAWSYENWQRNCISRGLVNCSDDDTIIISDLDEIPNPEKIAEYKNASGIIAFQQPLFYYYLNLVKRYKWNKAKMLKYSNFKSILDDYEKYSVDLPCELNKGTTANKIRLYKGKKQRIVKNGGWHFSYLSSPEQIQLKIISYSHQEHNIEKITNIANISDKIAQGVDLFGQGKLYKVKITREDFPAYIFENQEKFSDNILTDAKLTIAQAKRRIFVRRLFRLSKRIKRILRTLRIIKQ